jgi:hypothetical protein
VLQICDMGQDGFYFSSEEGVLRIFFALKDPTASAGFEPVNMGTKGQHAASRPPKPGLTLPLLVSYFTCFIPVMYQLSFPNQRLDSMQVLYGLNVALYT